MRELVESIGPVKRVLYGDVWSVTNQQVESMDHADMAYLNVPLNGHTDGTYFIDSPGLQFFHCHQHTGVGGETLLVDSIGAAEKLRIQDPQAFDFLSTTSLPARYYEPGHCYRMLGPIIKLDPDTKQVFHCRINGDDRDTLSNLSHSDVELFYHSIHALTSLLRAEESELWFKLTPGNALIVNNWRVLHGRKSFTGVRTLSGCYLTHDEYLSKLRSLLLKHKSVPC